MLQACESGLTAPLVTPFVAGCMIQRRIVNVFSVPGPSARFAWINVMALARLNLVTLICLVSFVLRSLDLAYLIYHHQVGRSRGGPRGERDAYLGQSRGR